MTRQFATTRELATFCDATSLEMEMAKQKSSDPRRANFEVCNLLQDAAMTRQFAATQELATFCNAINPESTNQPASRAFPARPTIFRLWRMQI